MKSGPPNSTIFVLGATGSGKTQLIADLVLQCPRFVIFDTRKDFEEKFMRATVVFSPKEMLEKLANKATQRIVFRLSVFDTAGFDIAMKAIYQFQELNHKLLPPIKVVVDELNRFADSGAWGENFATVIQNGRDYKIEKVFGAQWFGSLPTWVRDTITEIYAFKHTDDAGVDRLQKFGFFGDDLRNLPPYHTLYYGKGEVKTVKIVGSPT